MNKKTTLRTVRSAVVMCAAVAAMCFMTQSAQAQCSGGGYGGGGYGGYGGGFSSGYRGGYGGISPYRGSSFSINIGRSYGGGFNSGYRGFSGYRPSSSFGRSGFSSSYRGGGRGYSGRGRSYGRR